MGIPVEIFYSRLKAATSDNLELEGGTIRECLDNLVRRFPDTKKLLFDDRGALLKEVYVYVNQESAQKPGLDTPVRHKDRLIIAALVVGG